MTSTLNRRSMLKKTALAGGAALLAACGMQPQPEPQQDLDTQVLNFALNLEYLEAEFYLAAVGRKPSYAIGGVGGAGEAVIGGRPVVFSNTELGQVVREYAEEIAEDEERHVIFLRQVLGNKAVARPSIDVGPAFAAAAAAASNNAIQGFDAYANEFTFLLASFIFEDVGVTAYKGAARLITNKDVLEAAAGILGVEAYHAAEIRTLLYSQRDVVAAAGLNLGQIVQAISDLRDALAGSEKDQGITSSTPDTSNIVPVDANAIAFSRSTDEVLNIVYGNTTKTPGLFFPKGLNGVIR